jgi:type II secretory pathway pseudopilin PulG
MKTSNCPRNQAGFSVVEVLIVVVVIMILAAFAVMQFGASAANLERQNVAREFKVNLERARFDSVKRRATGCADMSRVEITGPTPFQLVTDRDQNGTLNPATETTRVDFTGAGRVLIVDDPAPTYPIVFRFDQRGNVSSGSCGSETPADTPTTFCQVPCTAATASSNNASLIYVSPTGTVSMLAGGESIPSFSAPSVADMNSNANYLNPLLAVWDAPSNTTNTNTNTATPTPPSTPTNTGTNTNTTSPTPTPGFCISGQRPAQDNCICSNTQYLQGSRCRDAN